MIDILARLAVVAGVFAAGWFSHVAWVRASKALDALTKAGWDD